MKIVKVKYTTRVKKYTICEGGPWILPLNLIVGEVASLERKFNSNKGWLWGRKYHSIIIEDGRRLDAKNHCVEYPELDRILFGF